MRIDLSLRYRREGENVRLDDDLLLRAPKFPDDGFSCTTTREEEDFGNLRR